MEELFPENKYQIIKKKEISIKDFLDKQEKVLGLNLLEGKTGLNNLIYSSQIHFPAFALSGFLARFSFDRIQFISEMEWYYLDSLSSKDRNSAIANLFTKPIPMVIVTGGRPVCEELINWSKRNKVPLLSSKQKASELNKKISTYLNEYFASNVAIHGSLADVYGVGLLFIGKSGCGKSECVLDLVEKGHRMVADDIVNIKNINGNLIGKSNEILEHHMEIRGLGIIDIQALFGIRSIRKSKRIEIIVELVPWADESSCDRIGLDTKTKSFLGVDVEKVKVPIFPGRNITIVSEIIAMNNLLKMNGVNSAQQFNERLIARMQAKHIANKSKKRP